jgi:hypothetical protein
MAVLRSDNLSLNARHRDLLSMEGDHDGARVATGCFLIQSA